MSKTYKNQKGFTAVEGLLIILILAVISFGGYYVYHTNHKTRTTAISTTSKSMTTNPYAGWKTYTALSPITFKYPSQWTVSVNNNLTPGDHSISVNAPARTINGTSYQFGLGFATYPNSSLYFVNSFVVNSSAHITDSSFPHPLYFLLTDMPQSNGSTSCVTDVQVSPTNVSQGGISGQTPMPTSSSGIDIDIDGNYIMTNPASNLSYDQTIGCFSGSDYSSFPEIQQAKQIISSLSEN